MVGAKGMEGGRKGGKEEDYGMRLGRGVGGEKEMEWEGRMEPGKE